MASNETRRGSKERWRCPDSGIFVLWATLVQRERKEGAKADAINRVGTGIEGFRGGEVGARGRAGVDVGASRLPAAEYFLDTAL